MSVFDTVIAIFAPHECVGCGAEGSLLCPECAATLPVVPLRCYRCKRLTPEAKTCKSCRSSSALYKVSAATVYDGAARDIVWRLKFHGAQAAAADTSQLMAPYIDPTVTLVTHVPTATSRVRQRGYDQARLMARHLARANGLPYAPLLTRMGQHHQVGASRERRVTQLATAFRVNDAQSVRGAHIVLIDDVLTTGATLEAAAKALKAAGAARVDGLVFAQA